MVMGAQGPAAGLGELANGPSTPYGGVGRPGQASVQGWGSGWGAQLVCPSWDSSMAVTD